MQSMTCSQLILLTCVQLSILAILPANDSIAISISPEFTVIGQTPEHQAWGVSANGEYVVGWRSGDGTMEAFRWDEVSGIIGLGDLPGGRFWSQANAVANDGVVVGTSEVNDNGATNPFRWSPSTNMLSLGTLGGSEVQGFGNDVSADGSVIVGMSKDSLNHQIAYRWTEAGGMEPLGVFDSSSSSEASGISHDGTVIVGSGASGTEGWYWNLESGFQGAGRFDDFSLSIPRATSSDGKVIVGDASFPGAPNRLAFVSIGPGTFASLGHVPGGAIASIAYDISGDARLIVGGSDVDIATIWERNNNAYQIYDLKQYLESRHGFDLGSWTLTQANSISEDGRVIVGNGVSPEGQSLAWRVVIPVPEPTSIVFGMFGMAAMLLVSRRRSYVRCGEQWAPTLRGSMGRGRFALDCTIPPAEPGAAGRTHWVDVLN
jgi:probable HAF family extracellular repeat protein